MRQILVLFFWLFTCIAQPEVFSAQDTAPANPPHATESNSIFPVEDLFEEARKPDDKFWMEFVNMLFTLGFIIGLILIVAWFLKRMVNNKLEQSNQISTIKVIERRSLSPKTSIYLIEIHEKTIALAESADGVALLTEFPFTLSQTEGEAQEVPSAFKKILDNKTQ